MILASSYQSLLSNPKHREALLAEWRKGQSKETFDRSELVHFYASPEHQYYRFPDSLSLPFPRYAMAKDYLALLASGLDRDEHRKLLDEQAKCIQEGLKNPKAAARAAQINQEMAGRLDMTLHHELIINFLAVQIVRDDENPLIFNNQIQLQKVEYFIKESDEGNAAFFLRSQVMSKVFDFSKTTENELMKFWNESRKNQQFLKKFLGMKFSFDTAAQE